MRVNSGKQFQYRDSLARKKRRLFRSRLFGLLFLLLALTGGAGYALFFTPIFQIRDVIVNGLEPEQHRAVLAYIYEVMAGRSWSYLEPNKNIFIFDADGIANKFLSEYPVLSSAKTRKTSLHTVQFDFVQRTALGVWCFRDKCVYFDENGKTWGQAARSSGFLLLTVQDDRSGDRTDINQDILTAVKVVAGALPDIGIRIKRISIPADFFNEFSITTNKGYALLMSLDSNLHEQLGILRTLIEQKGSEKSFAPAYIDLRIDGRIYYK